MAAADPICVACREPESKHPIPRDGGVFGALIPGCVGCYNDARPATILKFQKKPVVVEAVQWTNDRASQRLVLALDKSVTFAGDGTADLVIRTLEGEMRARPGDWIIRGVRGEVYPCRAEIFWETYRAVISERIDLAERALRRRGRGVSR